MVVALTDRSESSDALSDGSTTDAVVFEGDSEGAEEFPQSPVEEEVGGVRCPTSGKSQAGIRQSG